MKKISVYIDGQNTYFALKAMGISRTTLYDYKKMIVYVTGSTNPEFVGYYVGQLPRERNNEKSEKLYEDQQKFLNALKHNVPKLQVVLGKVIKVMKSDGNPAFYEKGVDVRLAIDMAHHAIQNKFDEAFLLSSDSDLIPAVKLAQEYGKTIHYVGFQKQKSVALLAECDVSRILSAEECCKFSESHL